MKASFTILLGMLALAFLPSFALAQTGSLSGQIIDGSTGDVLPGANVFIEDARLGAAADITGSYKIANIPAGTYTVTASFIGFRQHNRTIEIVADQEVTANFELEPDYTGLEEVVVTGIASSTSKVRSTVAVSRVNAEELTETNTYQDLSQLVGGKVAGVNVLPSSGNVGGGIRFNVRGGGGLNGQGQPVVYVDGVRLDNAEYAGFGAGGQGVSTLADLNPEDIASIDFLKGPASTAIYGTEGANGVVIITTKRGSLARASTLSVRYKGAFGQNERIREYDDAIYGTAADANALFREGAIRQHTLSVSGGSDAVTFFASVDNRFEEGIIRNNQGERTSFRANFNAYPSDKVTIKASTAYTLNDLQRPDNDNNILGQLGNTLLFSTPYAFTDSLSAFDIDDRFDVNRFLGSLEASYAPIRDLEISGTFGYDASNTRQDRTFPQNRTYSGVTDGERNIFIRDSDQYNGNINARYRYLITPHIQATSIVGGQFFDEYLTSFFGTAQQFSTPLVTDIGTGSEIQDVGESQFNARQAGLYAQQQVSINNTYFLEALVRRDYASAIGEDASSITYPSIRGSVRLDQFAFVPTAFDLLKLRLAYGEAGNLPNLDDVVAVLYQASPSGFGAGARVGGVGNAALVPERVREVEVGLDTELFARVSLEATYFRTFSDDSIIQFSPAPSTGFGAFAVERNVGQINGQGVELAFGVTPITTRRYQLDLDATYAYQTTEVVDLGGSPPIFDGFDLNVIREGLPRSAYYTPEVTGALFNEDGTYAGVAFAEDGERQFLGVPFPEHFGAFSLNARVYGLNIYALADYALGHRLFNSTESFAAQFGNHVVRNTARAQLFGTGPLAGEVAQLTPGSDEYREAADQYALTDGRFDSNFLEDADYLKLREITVSYDFADLYEQGTGRTDVRSLLIGLSARNVFTTTKYNNPDPEVNFTGSRSLSRGQDFLTLQNPRALYLTISVGI